MNLEAFLIGALGGAASGIAVPVVRDQIAWRVDKKRWARELLHDSLDRIANLADDADSDFAGQFALAGQRPADGVTESIDLVKTLHKENHRLELYLSGDEARSLATFLNDARGVLSEAKETWGQWHEHEEDLAIDAHNSTTLHAFGKASRRALDILKPTESRITKVKRYFRSLAGKRVADEPSAEE